MGSLSSNFDFRRFQNAILEQFWVRVGVDLEGGRAILDGILELAEAKLRA